MIFPLHWKLLILKLISTALLQDQRTSRTKLCTLVWTHILHMHSTAKTNVRCTNQRTCSTHTLTAAVHNGISNMRIWQIHTPTFQTNVFYPRFFTTKLKLYHTHKLQQINLLLSLKTQLVSYLFYFLLVV